MESNERGVEELDQGAILKKLLELVTGSSEVQANISDNVAQLITAAISQVIQSQQQEEQREASDEGGQSKEQAGSSIQSQFLTPAENVGSIIEVPGYSTDARSLGVKFPAEVRKKIISMRKEGLKCKDIAKDLGASVSGVQKVWERFLATGTIRDRKPSTYAGRPRKSNVLKLNEGAVSTTSPVSDSNYVDTVSPQAVLVDTREPMEVPGATVEVVASTSAHLQQQESPPAKKKAKTSYREELLLKLVANCPLAAMRNDIAMAMSPHVQNLSESITKPLYMEYVLGHPFGKAPSPKPFEPDVEESKVILTDPVNPLGKEVISALGYSTKVYLNACCKPSPLFSNDPVQHKLIPYSIGPGHIAKNMRQVLQVLIDLCSDPVEGLRLIQKGPGPVLQAHIPDSEVIVASFTPPTKLSEYWTQLYAYAKLFRCCENFLSPGPPSCPCLICHPFESFADSLNITDCSPPSSPYQLADSSILMDTAAQLLQLHPETQLDVPHVVIETPEQIVVSQESDTMCLTTASDQTNEEVCFTEPHHGEEEICITRTNPQDTPSHSQDTDGIQFVAYSTSTEETHPPLRRSSRKRPHPNYLSPGTKQSRKHT